MNKSWHFSKSSLIKLQESNLKKVMFLKKRWYEPRQLACSPNILRKSNDSKVSNNVFDKNLKVQGSKTNLS